MLGVTKQYSQVMPLTICVEKSVHVVFDESDQVTSNEQEEDFEIGLTRFTSDITNLEDEEPKIKEKPND